jgi:hypothetical protein
VLLVWSLILLENARNSRSPRMSSKLWNQDTDTWKKWASKRYFNLRYVSCVSSFNTDQMFLWIKYSLFSLTRRHKRNNRILVLYFLLLYKPIIVVTMYEYVIWSEELFYSYINHNSKRKTHLAIARSTFGQS